MYAPSSSRVLHGFFGGRGACIIFFMVGAPCRLLWIYTAGLSTVSASGSCSSEDGAPSTELPDGNPVREPPVRTLDYDQRRFPAVAEESAGRRTTGLRSRPVKDGRDSKDNYWLIYWRKNFPMFLFFSHPNLRGRAIDPLWVSAIT